MNHKCWNCGQDFEVSGKEFRAAERQLILHRLDERLQVYRATGNGLLYGFYRDVVDLVQSIR